MTSSNCAGEGSVVIDGVETTLLIAPMNGFYDIKDDESNPGSTQFRISFVETTDIPHVFEKYPAVVSIAVFVVGSNSIILL